MIKSKWIRRALLGGVAMAVMASGAQAADDLEALKAQIEALQARVNAIETKGVNLPEGVSLITFQRGAKEIAMVGGDDTKALDKAPESRGFTIAITPTADLPAPTTEITISGNIRVLALWGKGKISGNNNGTTSASDSDFDLAARGTVDITSRTDTAIGQVRTRIQIRNQFSSFGFAPRLNNNGGVVTPMRVVDDQPGDQATPDVDARLAFGEWDFMPNWTLRAGHAGQIAAVTNVAYSTQPAMYGLDSTRHNQVQIIYNGGPLSFGFGIENPSQDNLGGFSTTTMPDIAGFAQFNAPMGLSLRVTGEAGKVGSNTWSANTGYLIGVGAAASVSMLNLNAGFVYTKGLACDGIFSAAYGYCRVGTAGGNMGAQDNNTGRLAKAYGFQVNAGLTLTETVSTNASFGYFNYTNLVAANDVDHGFSVGGNLVWRPVDALQIAAEVDYFRAKQVDGDKGQAIAAGVGFWFFF